MLTQDELKAHLYYDRDIGLFTHLVNSRRCKIGRVAGQATKDGYIRIGVNGKRYYAHRLAFLYMTGEWPADQIDHINQIKSDNRIDNLREVSSSENQQNRTNAQSNNKSSGLLGVTCKKDGGKFRARIYVNNKQIHIGYFGTKREAHEAYLNKKSAMHIPTFTITELRRT